MYSPCQHFCSYGLTNQRRKWTSSILLMCVFTLMSAGLWSAAAVKGRTVVASNFRWNSNLEICGWLTNKNGCWMPTCTESCQRSSWCGKTVFLRLPPVCRVRRLLHGALYLPAGDAAQLALIEAGGRVPQHGVWEQQRGPRQNHERYSVSDNHHFHAKAGIDFWIVIQKLWLWS